MRVFLLAVSLCFILPAMAYAEDDWQSNWLFSETEIYTDQLLDSCLLFNHGQEKAVCAPDKYSIVITSFFPLKSDDVLSDPATMALRFKIRNLQIVAMRAGKKVRMIDKSAEPYMTGLYQFVSLPTAQQVSFIQESYGTLKGHCAKMPDRVWYCDRDRP